MSTSADIEDKSESAAASGASYSQILKSSSIIGGAQVINMLIGMVRTKLVAILIGPSGVGLVNMYQSVTSMALSLAGLGIQSSGVRDVAEAVGSSDKERIGKTIITLRRICWVTGSAGFLMLCLLANAISWQLFGSGEYAWSIRLLGVTVLLGDIAGGQAAVIQGTRRIADLARIAVVGSVGSTIVAGAVYGLVGIRGVVPVLLSVSMISLGVTYWFARQIPIQPVKMTWLESFKQARGLVTLGLAFLWNGLLLSAVAYVTNLILSRELGLSAVGIFAAAYSLSGLFVQFVLQAMGADYYPRLTAVAHDHSLMNKQINEQTEIGLLLAFPGLLATLALAPWFIWIFYAPEFSPAAALLRWFILGCMGRVVSWPMAFSLLAKGKGLLFATTETAFNSLHVCLIIVCVKTFGLVGVSIALPIVYLFYTAALLVIVGKLTGFIWQREVLALLLWMVPLAFLIFLGSFWLPPATGSAVGVLTATFSATICLRCLAIRVGPSHRICRTLMKLPGGAWFLPNVCSAAPCTPEG